MPLLADYCTVDLLEPDGSVSSIAFAHADPSRTPWVEEARALQHVSTDAPSGPGRVIREGTPELIPLITREMVMASNPTEQQLAFV